MSRFMSPVYSGLVPYVPGEQPQDRKYVKLNTNESPYRPDNISAQKSFEAALGANLYSDPECRVLREKLASVYGVKPSETVITNGSDEVLNFAVAAFGTGGNEILFPDITYGFYPVFAEMNRAPYREIPLDDNFNVRTEDYICADGMIIIANPNAPTGIAMSVSEIERIVASNPGNVVVIDEAYVDFGAQSCAGLIHVYDNLLVTGTFSKSRSLAGARVGFGIGSEELIKDLNTIRYSTNPYNVNSLSMALAVSVLENNDIYMENCRHIAENREYLKKELSARGFTVTDSKANFVFAKYPGLEGKDLYLGLKEKGVLVRHFAKERIKDYLRITVGNDEQIKTLLLKTDELLEELK